MKKFNHIKTKGIAVAGVLAIGVSGYISETRPKQNSLKTVDEYFSMVQPHLALFQSALAAEEGDAECNSKAQTAWSACFNKDSAYAHGALNFFNSTLCTLNNGFPSQVETSLCHFNKSMGMNPDKGSLPITISKTFGAKSVSLTVEKPSETFATSAGYDAKGTVSVNGAKFMVLYWGGTDSSSKGFMISGASGMGGDSSKRPSYIQWDRTNKTSQFVKVFVANYKTSYLTTFSAMSKDSPQGGDRAMYGQATYNSSSKSMTAQTVSIEGQRGGSSTSAGCFKMFGTGVKEGTVSVAKTKNAFSQTGHSVSDTSKDGTDMDAAVLVDSVSTANGTGNYNTTTDAGMTVSFNKSCSDVNGAGATGKAFASGDVNFSATPSDIF